MKNFEYLENQQSSQASDEINIENLQLGNSFSIVSFYC